MVASGSTLLITITESDWILHSAWETEQYTLEVFERLKFSTWDIIENSDLRAAVECTLRFGLSTATIRISLDALPASLGPDSRSLIRFDCTVDWHERHRMLRFELPMNLWATEATFDSAFGVVTRPTHRNTSWEAARFEVVGHKFADYSEFGYGVALLNDCKYGYNVQGNVMTLSLLRASTMPDQEADQGGQEFSFALYPHLGKYAESDVEAVSRAFNNPLKGR